MPPRRGGFHGHWPGGGDNFTPAPSVPSVPPSKFPEHKRIEHPRHLTPEDHQLLDLAASLVAYEQASPYYLQPAVEVKEIERYADKYRRIADQNRQHLALVEVPDAAGYGLPADLETARNATQRVRLSGATAGPSSGRAKRQRRSALASKLEEVPDDTEAASGDEEDGEDEDGEGRQKKRRKGTGDGDEGDDDDDEEEDMEAEDEEDNDYTMYYDGEDRDDYGDDGGGGDDDNTF